MAAAAAAAAVAGMEDDRRPLPPPPLPRGWTLLCRSAEKSVSKALLEVLAAPESALDCYRRYLQSTISFSVSYRTVSLLDDDNLGRYYVIADPACDPKYFNALCRSGGDLAKMERCTRRRLVLLHPSLPARHRWDDSILYKVHDRRVWTTLLDGRPDLFGESGLPPVVAVLVKLPGRRVGYEVYQLDEVAAAAQYRALWSERDFREGRPQPFSGCLLAGLCRALGCPLPPAHDCPRGRFCTFSGRADDLSRPGPRRHEFSRRRH